jgi:methylated-DNA-[protein]-cysteine S-methyltransferase
LQTIPYGQQISYKTISDLLQTDKTSPHNLSRAVGGAVGHNPISIIIPCHRVIGSNGALTGYAGGIERKEFLLQLERKIKS